MKIQFLLAGLLLVASSTSAMAAGPYIGAATGISVFHDSDLSTGGTGEIEYEGGLAAKASLGYNFDGFRLEGDFGYKRADVATFRGNDVPEDSMDTAIFSYMINAYWDIKTGRAVTPFIGAGIGKLHARMTDPSGAYRDDVLGYQISVGTGVRLTDKFSLDLGYRYEAAAEDFFIGVYDVSYASSNFFGGVRYTF